MRPQHLSGSSARVSSGQSAILVDSATLSLTFFDPRAPAIFVW